MKRSSASLRRLTVTAMFCALAYVAVLVIHISGIGGFLTFADFFFDGFLADFLVQSRIHGAIDRLEQACRQVEDVLYRLSDAND